MFVSQKAQAQGIQVIYTVSNFHGGNNVSCHGSSDGWINVVVVGGMAPYYFNWSNNSYSQNLSNVVAGNYTVTITDMQGSTASVTITMREPNALSIHLVPIEYEGGYNISENGGHNGFIETEISGGVQDYSYLWSNNATDSKIEGLTAGLYSLTVNDMNGCASSSSVTLIEPTELHVVSIASPLNHGYNISCNDKHDGVINLSVTGGYQGGSGYHYKWNNGSTEQNPERLSAGHYSVIITDDNNAAITAQIDLTQPPKFEITNITPLIYPNGNHLSCHTCANGKLTVNVTGGVSPLTYHWELGQTTQTISNLSANTYYVTVTDANGCTSIGNRQITAPDQEDWSMTGNLNTNPATQFMGTSDNKDFVFRTNNIERLRITSSGNIQTSGLLKISPALLTNYNSTYVDNTGTLRINPSPGGNNCLVEVPEPWLNDNCHQNSSNIILREPFASSAKVGIGTTDPQAKLDIEGNLRIGNLAGFNGFNLLSVGHDGIINSLHPPQTYPYEYFLCGNGTWSGLPSGASAWIKNGTNIYNNPLNTRVGIGTQSPHDNFEIGNGFTLHSDMTNNWMSYNSTWDGANDLRTNSGGASRINLNANGNIDLLTANSGTANSAISWKRLQFNSLGQLGINCTPSKTLTVNGDASVNGDAEFLSNANGNNIFQLLSNNQAPHRRGISLGDEAQQNGGAFNFYIHDWQDNSTFNFLDRLDDNVPPNLKTLLTIRKDGSLGLNTNGSNYSNSNWMDIKIDGSNDNRIVSDGALSIYLDGNNDGTSEFFEIFANDVSNSGNQTALFKVTSGGVAYMKALKVTLQTFPDYVFGKDYKILPISEVKEYITNHHRLPGLPSSKEVIENGLDVGEINVKLVEKIEELTIYITQLQDQIDELKKK